MRSSLVKYAVALVCLIVAVGVRMLLNPLLGDRYPFITIALAYVLVLWQGGRGPAIGYLLLGLAAGTYFFLDPRQSLEILTLDNQIGVAIHLLLGLCLLQLAESLRGAKRRLEQEIGNRNAAEAELQVNVADRKGAQEALRASEERFRAIFSQANVGIAEADLSGRMLLVNDKFCQLVGYTREELLAINYQEITHPDDRQACAALFERSMAEKSSFTTEKRYIRKDGSIIWANSAVSSVRNQLGQPIYAVGVIQDITARKQAEASILAKQELLNQLYDSQENERRLVAFELHDGPIQYMTGALLHLDTLAGKVAERPAELELAMHLLRKALLDSRRLMNGIRPPVLDESGLVPAIEQLLVQQRTESTTVEFVNSPDLGRFAPSLESAVYRIVQEGLTNAQKHSRSDRVRISLGRTNDHLRLEIQDWGVGFKPSEIAERRGGLQGFAERVRLAGGDLTIDSAPGQGTRIVVDLPIVQAP